ncbi:hypothetical protein [Streptomyces sp. AHA2]
MIDEATGRPPPERLEAAGPVRRERCARDERSVPVAAGNIDVAVLLG